MKLISCYVENFGCISKKDYLFDGNLTSINEENGFGKSTLASFIKAMFYGLDAYRSNYSKEEKLPERLHYYPFNGGSFGGNLTFEFNEKTYKIERFFGEKSDTLDTLRVYVNGEETFEFGEDVGKAVFGVDKESFERIAFIGSDEITIKSTSSINLKLNEFLQGTQDDVSLDVALSKLDATAKEYKKSRQSRDKITLEQEKISELTAKIVNARAVKSALGEKLSSLNELKNAISSISNEIEAAQKTNEQITAYEHYEELLSIASASNEKAQEVCKKYNGKLPLEEEITALSNAIIKERELTVSLSSGLSDGEKIELENLQKTFAGGVPTEEQLVAVENKVNELSSLQATKSLVESEKPSDAMLKLSAKFSSGLPKPEVVNSADGKVEEYKKLKAEVESTGGGVIYTNKKPPLSHYLPFAIICALILIVGIALIFVNAVIGAIVTAVGFLSILVVAFIYLNAKTSGAYYGKTQAYNASCERASIIESELRNLLNSFGYTTSDGVLLAYSTFKRDLSDYIALLKIERERVEKLSKLTASINSLNDALINYFNGFNINQNNLLGSIASLKSKVSSFNLLNAKLEGVKAKKQRLNAEISAVRETISAFDKKYGTADVNAVLADVNAYKTELKNACELDERAKAYKAEKKITVRPSGAITDISNLNSTLIKMQEDYALLSSQIEADEYAVERLDGYVSDKAVAEENLARYKKNYQLLTATIAFLQKAEQNLKDRYVKPVKDEFLKYSALIEQTLGEKVTMTKNFEITFERNGKERSEKHLSAGIKSICALCFRLALIKNMYRDKAPFLILDDPFVFLDEPHFEKVKSVIAELSKEMQIIYFTCHDSRKIK
ncbi:MAG: hypothetical protein IJA97_01495 [Clostridia bacterium]|nr:hypothetical protein [Clostridia bacterium]